MTNGNDWDDEDDKSDLTRLEDLSDFLHEEDPELEEKLSHGLEEEKEDLTSNNEFDHFSDEKTQPDIDLSELSVEPEETEESEEPTSFTSEDILSEPPPFTDEATSSQLFDSEEDFQQHEEVNEPFTLEEDEEPEPIAWQEQEQVQEEEEAEGEDEIQHEVQHIEEPLMTEEVEERIEEDPPTAPPVTASQHAPRENFQEVRNFGNAISYGHVTTGGNPPFSIILSNIKYKEDAEDIMIILREHQLVNDSTLDIIEQGLKRGHVLISQISEYSAIYLAHRFRRFDLDLKIGLSHELHPSKSYDTLERGLVSKSNLRQNKDESSDFSTSSSMNSTQEVMIVTTKSIPQYDIKKYLDIVTASRIVPQDQLMDYDEEHFTYRNDLDHSYQEIAQTLKQKAQTLGANAVLGVQYQIVPLVEDGQKVCNITCTGNAVWAVKNNE